MVHYQVYHQASINGKKLWFGFLFNTTVSLFEEINFITIMLIRLQSIANTTNLFMGSGYTKVDTIALIILIL
jgi:hypothetical protein